VAALLFGTRCSLSNEVAVGHGVEVIDHQLSFFPSIGIAKAFAKCSLARNLGNRESLTKKIVPFQGCAYLLSNHGLPWTIFASKYRWRYWRAASHASLKRLWNLSRKASLAPNVSWICPTKSMPNNLQLGTLKKGTPWSPGEGARKLIWLGNIMGLYMVRPDCRELSTPLAGCEPVTICFQDRSTRMPRELLGEEGEGFTWKSLCSTQSCPSLAEARVNSS